MATETFSIEAMAVGTKTAGM